ncbi:MAG: helix-turn-helix domain-containing protein [Ruminococcaceae bacterium]|nr:helix-turn-helix domain-containing protein [Oscillospiraceae bacterium]
MNKWYPFKTGEAVSISRFYTFFIKDYPKGYVFKGESHNFWECLYVMDGTLSVSADERVYELNRGNIIFHKPMELHKFTVTGDGGARLLIFSYAMTGTLYDYFCNKVFMLNDEQTGILNNTLSFMQEKSKDITCGERLRFFNKLLYPDVDSDIYLLRVTYYIYQFFLSLADDGYVEKRLKTPETELLKSAITFMNENLSKNPGVEDIAKHCSVSLSGIKRIFLKYTGLSVHKYFIKLKCNEALRLLSEGATVTQVTELLGFCTQSYFSSAFKREMGKNPSEYRRK